MTFNRKEYKYANITSGDTQIATGRGKLHSIVINSAPDDVVVVANSGTGETTPTIATFAASAPEKTYLYDVVFSTGLYITLAGTADITITYSQP